MFLYMKTNKAKSVNDEVDYKDKEEPATMEDA
jgi:hypothetical protein